MRIQLQRARSISTCHIFVILYTPCGSSVFDDEVRSFFSFLVLDIVACPGSEDRLNCDFAHDASSFCDHFVSAVRHLAVSFTNYLFWTPLKKTIDLFEICCEVFNLFIGWLMNEDCIACIFTALKYTWKVFTSWKRTKHLWITLITVTLECSQKKRKEKRGLE